MAHLVRLQYCWMWFKCRLAANLPVAGDACGAVLQAELLHAMLFQVKLLLQTSVLSYPGQGVMNTFVAAYAAPVQAEAESQVPTCEISGSDHHSAHQTSIVFLNWLISKMVQYVHTHLVVTVVVVVTKGLQTVEVHQPVALAVLQRFVVHEVVVVAVHVHDGPLEVRYLHTHQLQEALEPVVAGDSGDNFQVVCSQASVRKYSCHDSSLWRHATALCQVPVTLPVAVWWHGLLLSLNNMGAR